MATVDEVAEAAYAAYCTAVGGRAFNGDVLPTWGEQRQRNPKITDAWRAAAQAAVERSLLRAHLPGEGTVDLTPAVKDR